MACLQADNRRRNSAGGEQNSWKGGGKGECAPELRDGVVGVVDCLAPLLAQDAHAHVRRLHIAPTIKH
jgi:hypothetical protein